jgi:uncharacterized protein (TIGR00369 family)
VAEKTGSGGFAQRLGVEVESADDGSARVRFEAREEHLNPAGTLHGGVLATLVDTAMGTAVRSATDDGDVPATSQLTMTYLRPGTPGPVEVTARVPAGSPERVAAVSFRRQGCQVSADHPGPSRRRKRRSARVSSRGADERAPARPPAGAGAPE